MGAELSCGLSFWMQVAALCQNDDARLVLKNIRQDWQQCLKVGA
jgi:hypothetical protein